MRKFTIKEIQKIYPHRFPMLLVDSIDLFEDGGCVGYKYVSSDEIWFMGHFPGYPILPGIIILETMSQVGGMCFYDELLSNDEAITGDEKMIGFMAGYDKVRFYKEVIPGNILRFDVVKVAKFGTVGKVKGVATLSDGSKVSEAEINYSFKRVVMGCQ